MPKPIDDDIRVLAVSELERNIVVTAGAGTGKTTILVNRILHLLLGHRRFQGEESPIRRIVAMTFTEKAASDMKIRLVAELEKIVAVINGNNDGAKEKVESFIAHLRDTYQTTYREIERRARISLEDMDKAIIGTIHGFAAHVLRLYPLESGVTPGFTVDAGDLFDEMFDKEWTEWLEVELALDSSHAAVWKEVLRRLDLDSVKTLAKRLSEFIIPLDSLTDGADNAARMGHPHAQRPLPAADAPADQQTHAPASAVRRQEKAAEPSCRLGIDSLVNPLSRKILDVIACCEKPNNNLLTQLRELLKIFDAIKTQGLGYLDSMEYDLDKESKAQTGWTDEGFASAQALVKKSHALLKKLTTVDDPFVKTVTALVLSFAKAFRQKYTSQGYVSFDGLLILTRNLLQNKEYRHIREKLKDEFRTILVDEFQDTDPVQYEIVLFLSEALGHYSGDVRKVALEAGKLFIVGDPKQSIYAFRRADIEAYEMVTKQVCGTDDTLKLQENFRSHSGITEVVNQLFQGKIMVEQPGLQPCYIPIHAHRPKAHPYQKVEMVLVSDEEGKGLKASDAREAEAEWIARWISSHVNNEDIEDAENRREMRKLQYRDVALLLRAFTQLKPYIEAFKRYGIPYIVEGEKYFYTTQEVLDFINLLRIIENPHDKIALMGVLRSTLVGLTDREIYELQMHDLLDYRKDVPDAFTAGLNTTTDVNEPAAPSNSIGEGRDAAIEETPSGLGKVTGAFYRFLRTMHARAGIIPVSQLITEIMDNTHLAEIVAGAWHGEQKLSNVWKLYQMGCDMEQNEGVSLKTFIDRIRRRIKDARVEGESPLSDETLDVVKIMSIHKSKGLEFPVVFLGNLHGEVRNSTETIDSAVFDWSTATTGIVIGGGSQQARNLQSIIIEEKLNERSWEEEKRVLYVAMTRAKERLILTGSLKDDDKSYMGLIARAVRDVAGVCLDEATTLPQGDAKEAENIPASQRENKEGAKVVSNMTGKIPLKGIEICVEYFRFDGTRRPLKPPEPMKWDTDWTAFRDIWKEREAAMHRAEQALLFISPSGIAKKEAAGHDESPVIIEERPEAPHQNHAATIGTICH
ncbi:MAG TPA: UvrD-helicase domain-containing protein, partial [Candidatus Brocadiaceae bacterium]|nr:UvrD-helicase domain-containing protein [Candidatus Brocadiaceae bacterium]